MGIEGDVVSCLYEIVFDDNSLISGVPRFLNLKRAVSWGPIVKQLSFCYENMSKDSRREGKGSDNYSQTQDGLNKHVKEMEELSSWCEWLSDRS